MDKEPIYKETLEWINNDPSLTKNNIVYVVKMALLGRSKIMKEAKAQLEWSLEVECPHCNRAIMNQDLNDDEHTLVNCVFGTITKPAQWENIGLEFECPECGEMFRITDIEY